MDEPLQVLFVTSEVTPFARTGGLGDVTGALPKALAARGHDVRLVMPLYQTVRDYEFTLVEVISDLPVPLPFGTSTARVWQGHLPVSHESTSPVPVYFIDQREYFARPGLYGNADGEYQDNALRFIFFCRAALALTTRLAWRPDVFHCHDWQTGLIPAYLRVRPDVDPQLTTSATVYTVHNLAYQGLFPPEVLPFTGLPPFLFQPSGIEFFGRVSFMKAGLLYADAVTTVSPTYAEEICTPEFGYGLQGVLQSRRSTLSGILNGADYAVWNPEHDAALAATFSAADLRGKGVCKAALLQAFGLPISPEAPLIGMITRLVDQKGFDIIAAALDRLLNMNVRFVILGTGYPQYEEFLTRLASAYPQRIGVRLAFDDPLAHQIEAGCDFFLMPSRYEPCGLNQMYSLRYGTIPIVRATGGLRDSVVPFNSQTGQGTGFVFQETSGDALVATVQQALTVYANREFWLRLQQNAMAQDFSWERSAARYVEVYRQALTTKHASR